jgi:tetratricopeptide (TPR) repeat protein
LYRVTNRHAEAEEAFRESIALAESINYDAQLPYLNNGLARVLQQQDQPKKALSATSTALKQAELLQDQHVITQIYCTFGMIQRQSGELNESEAYLIKALGLADAIGDKALTLECLHEALPLLCQQEQYSLVPAIIEQIQSASETWFSTNSDITSEAYDACKQAGESLKTSDQSLSSLENTILVCLGA